MNPKTDGLGHDPISQHTDDSAQFIRSEAMRKDAKAAMGGEPGHAPKVTASTANQEGVALLAACSCGWTAPKPGDKEACVQEFCIHLDQVKAEE